MKYTPPEGYAPYWKRVVAAIVDGILWVVASLTLWTVSWMVAVLAAGGGYNVYAIIVLALFLGWPYNALMESSPWQATPGKMLVDIQVCDMQGNPIGFRRASGRYFSKFFSTALLGLGFLLPLFRIDRMALHDRMAKTLVINTPTNWTRRRRRARGGAQTPS